MNWNRIDLPSSFCWWWIVLKHIEKRVYCTKYDRTGLIYSYCWDITENWEINFAETKFKITRNTQKNVYRKINNTGMHSRCTVFFPTHTIQRRISIPGEMLRDRLFTLAFFWNVSTDLYLIAAIQVKVSGKSRSRDNFCWMEIRL